MEGDRQSLRKENHMDFMKYLSLIHISSPPEKINTDGTIINPAKKANPVSKISICRTELSRFVDFGI